MNKKLLISLLFFILFFAVFASADTCIKGDVLNSLRKALYIYYTDPSKSTFTKEELKDLLVFYTGIQGVKEEVECNSVQNSLANKANALQDNIPTCSDGTKYGKCNLGNKPMYCYAGRLVPRCRLCGCPTDQWCDEDYVYEEKGNKGRWGKCYPLDNVTNVTFDLALRIADCATLNTDCESGTGYEGVERYGCALEGATVKLEALNHWNSYSAQLVVNSGEHSEIGDAPAGRSEWIIFKSIPVWTGTPNYNANEGFYRITVTKDGYTSKTGLIGIFGTTGADLYWSREFIGNYICLNAMQEPPTCTPEEQLLVDFRSSSGATTTSQYSGLVDVSVVGTGQSSGIAYNDAFYVFTSYLNGQPITPKVQNPFLLYVDGKSVANVTLTPSYNSQHSYSFTFNVGTTPKKINFKIGDGYRVDNSGSFTIGVCTDAVGKCLDGTAYGQCSTTKPKYCDNGVLVDKCQTCGCDTGTCQTNGTCAPTGEVPITNCQELQNMNNNLEGDYYLANDIDCSATKTWNSGQGFEPIGNAEPSNAKLFTGSFDGKGHKITGLYIHRPNTDYIGLFGAINMSSVIKDVGMENVNVTGWHMVGGLVGMNFGSIMNSYSTGNVYGVYYAGGLVGDTWMGPGYSMALGGTVGTWDASISNSYSKATVAGLSKIGGLIGISGSRFPVLNSYSTGKVSGSESTVGGLCGFEGNLVSNSYWDTQTSGQATSAGGTGKTTAEMKQQITFTGWDFTNTWGICEGETYPWLQWEGVECGVGIEIVPVTTNTAYQRDPAIYGNKIVWRDERNDYGDIYMYDLSTQTETRITIDPGEQKLPDVYDNKIIWFDHTKWDIYMYDLSTEMETRITTDASEVYTLDPPSVYGDKIVWGDERNGNGDIYMYDLSTEMETRITTDPAIQLGPQIHGNRIAWADSRDGDWDIYAYDLSTGQGTLIQTSESSKIVPSIYGDKIVWADRVPGEMYWDDDIGDYLQVRSVYMYDLSTGQKTRITTYQSGSSSRAKIYGNKIVWDDVRASGRSDIYTYDLSTEQEMQVTTTDEQSKGAMVMDIYDNKVVFMTYTDGRNDFDIYMVTV